VQSVHHNWMDWMLYFSSHPSIIPLGFFFNQPLQYNISPTKCMDEKVMNEWMNEEVNISRLSNRTYEWMNEWRSQRMYLWLP
jgi:hypothetical protein